MPILGSEYPAAGAKCPVSIPLSSVVGVDSISISNTEAPIGHKRSHGVIDRVLIPHKQTESTIVKIIAADHDDVWIPVQTTLGVEYPRVARATDEWGESSDAKNIRLRDSIRGNGLRDLFALCVHASSEAAAPIGPIGPCTPCGPWTP